MRKKNSAIGTQGRANRRCAHGLLNRVPANECGGQDRVAQRARVWAQEWDVEVLGIVVLSIAEVPDGDGDSWRMKLFPYR